MSGNHVSSRQGGMSSGRLREMTGALQGSVSSALTSGQGQLDHFFPPEKRQQLKDIVAQFATERPYLASFLLSQVALSGPAIALFVIMTTTVTAFSLLTALLVALGSALSFIVFSVGIASCFLLPTLVVTIPTAVGIWMWSVGAYYVYQWFNKKDVSGTHTNTRSGVRKPRQLDSLPGGVVKNRFEQGEDETETWAEANENLINGANASGTDAARHRAHVQENHARLRMLENSQARAGDEHEALNKAVPDFDGRVGAIGDVKKEAGIYA